LQFNQPNSLASVIVTAKNTSCCFVRCAGGQHILEAITIKYFQKEIDGMKKSSIDGKQYLDYL
jgi:hypothetical protein